MRIRLGFPSSKSQWAMALQGGAFTAGSAIPLAMGVYSLFWPKVDGVITHSREMAGYRTIGGDIGYRYSASGGSRSGKRRRRKGILTDGQSLTRSLEKV